MQKIIAPSRRHSSVRFPPCVIYVDTLHCFFRRWSRGLDELRLRHPWQIEIRRLSIDRGRGYTVRAQRVTAPIICDLAALQFAGGKQRATISRLDVAYDWPAETQESRYRLRRFLFRHLLLRHRRAGDMQWWHDSEATAWKTYKEGQRPPAKNLILYDDKPSKVDGRPCVHLDLRMYGPALRRAGIDRIGGLLTLNPAHHLAQFCRLVTHIRAKGSLTIFHQRHPRKRLVDLPWSRLRLPDRPHVNAPFPHTTRTTDTPLPSVRAAHPPPRRSASSPPSLRSKRNA